jgi:protease-4
MPLRRIFPLALAASLLVPLFTRADDTEKKPEPRPILVDLTIKGSVPEEPAPLGLEGEPLTDNLRSLTETLKKAKEDPQVKGLVLRLRDLKVGLAKTNELRQALADFRSSGKKTFAVMEEGGNAEYLIASAADEIIMPESGSLMIKGLAAEVMFYKKAFDKLGIKAQMMQVGDYKGAGEPYTRSEMSPEFEANLKGILSDNYDMIAEAVADRLDVDVSKAKELLENGPYTAESAKEAGLIDRVAYPDEVEDQVEKSLDLDDVTLETKYNKNKKDTDFSGFAGFMKMMQALSGETAKKAESKKSKVALILASGMITTGKSQSGGLMGDSTMGSETVVKQIRKAADDKTVKAVVLRVDSPGGSALASDLIWREIVRLDKPVVASMSDVAASGGYYISMGADKIYAEPGTITGSIGVVGGKIALGGLLDKVGLTTDTVSVGKNGLLMSPYRPFDDDEQVAMRKLMEEIYRQFVSKAAKGRQMEYEELEKLAGGRVYTGRQAKKAGLVDEVGTLSDAIAAAKDLAKLDKDEDVELLILPEAKGVLEALLAPLEDLETSAPPMGALPASMALLPDSVQSALLRVGRMAKLLQSEPTLVVMPFEVNIR